MGAVVGGSGRGAVAGRARRAMGLLVTAGVVAGCGGAAGAGTPGVGSTTASRSSTSSTSSPGAGRSTASACPSGWGTAARTSPSNATAPLVTVRATTERCSDRLVLEFAGRVDGYDVRYVPQVLADASGTLVPLAGGARLKVTVVAPAYGPTGVTYRPRDPAHVAGVAGFRVFRQVAWAGSFEGSTTLGVGVRARLPFEVSLLPGPGGHSRVVVDVAHHG